MTAKLVAALMMLISPVLYAQSAAAPAGAAAAKPIAFDVVSVKENKSVGHSSNTNGKPDGVTLENVSLFTIIRQVYGLNFNEQILGAPEWSKQAHYDIVAKVAPEDLDAFHKMKFEEKLRMLQPVLAERFHLTAVAVTKELPTYDLVVEKNGPNSSGVKVTPPGDNPNNGGWQLQGQGSENHLMMYGVPMTSLAQALMREVSRAVVDKTGLGGKYDIDMKWSPDDATQTDASGPSLFTAVQEQLGLKLVPSKGPVECIAIDHVERPTAN